MAAARARRGRRGRSRGQALVEFALVVPIFLLVLCGILDFGFMLFNRMTVINAAREGARVAAMTADDTTVTTVATNRVIAAAASAGMGLTASNVQIGCLETSSASYSWTTGTPTCTWTLHTSGNATGAQTGDSVTVRVTYSYHTFFPLLFGASIPLTTTVQMVLDNVTTG